MITDYKVTLECILYQLKYTVAIVQYLTKPVKKLPWGAYVKFDILFVAMLKVRLWDFLSHCKAL